MTESELTHDKLSYVQKRQEALKEYYFAEEIIDRYDDRSLKIKSWSITASAVALGFGFSERQPVLFALASIGSLAFWYLECLWKIYQSILINRARELEALLSTDTFFYSGPKIVHSFESSFRSSVTRKKLFQVMWYRNVWVPHFFIILLGVLLSIAFRLRA